MNKQEAKRETRFSFGTAFSRDFLAFYRGFKEKLVSLLEGNVEMLETVFIAKVGSKSVSTVISEENLENPLMAQEM